MLDKSTTGLRSLREENEIRWAPRPPGYLPGGTLQHGIGRAGPEHSSPAESRGQRVEFRAPEVAGIYQVESPKGRELRRKRAAHFS